MAENAPQLVVIDGNLTYAWSGAKPLTVGERVELPPTFWMSGPWVGVVTSIESSYTGPVKPVLRRARPVGDDD